MQKEMLCGDETNAVVADIGTMTCRFGTCGQDQPRHCFRSDICTQDLSDSQNSDKKERKQYTGDNIFRVLRDDYEVKSFGSASKIDSDDLETILRHGMEHSMRINPTEMSLMLAQGSYLNSFEAQSAALETCFESLGTPALFMMPNSVLSAFSAGRPTSLVIDCGANSTVISTVVDGYELKKASLKFPIGGNDVDLAVSQHLRDEELQPWFAVPGSIAFKNNFYPRESFLSLHRRDIVRDIKHWMSFIPYYYVPEIHRSKEGIRELGVTLPPSYELPDGTSIEATYSLCTSAEALFFPENASTSGHKRSRELVENFDNLADGFKGESLQDVVFCAAAKVDVDVRKAILANMTVVGAGSLLSGLPQRLYKELGDILPSHMKIKYQVGLPLERSHSAWIGGSILSICGSFQQLWVSKQNYEEHGDRIANISFQH